MKYYGLISGLTVPRPCQALDFRMGELRSRMEPFLSVADAVAVRHFFYRIDLYNAEALWRGEESWLEGGNTSEDQLRRSLGRGLSPEWSLSEEGDNLPDPADRAQTARMLHRYWQRYYQQQRSLAPEALDMLLTFEISLKNFTAGLLAAAMDPDAEPEFLEGGGFDRFAYSRLILADIQAEHPYLYAALSSLSLADVRERELKLTEAKWRFYNYAAFFDPFGLRGLFSLLLRYLDNYRWQQRDAELGKARMETLTRDLIKRTESQFV
jgi:hypothetical protein